MTKKAWAIILIILGILVFVFLAIGFYFLYKRHQQDPSTDQYSQYNRTMIIMFIVAVVIFILWLIFFFLKKSLVSE